jgi:aminoglycoside phosphotransferase (APT) family kinase protein
VVAAPEQVAAVLPRRDDRRRVADNLIDTLARLHQVDPTAIGPDRPYLQRHIAKLTDTWEAVRTRDLPQVTELAERLLDARPTEPRRGIVHSDFRLGNCMLGADGQVRAVLDWELSARGDVLADLGFLVNNWEQPDEPGPPVWMQPPPTRAGGFPERAALVERYQELTGFDVDGLDYYRAFVAWRMAIIAEGIKRRYESGAMANAAVDMGHLERRVHALVAQADGHLRNVGG